MPDHYTKGFLKSCITNSDDYVEYWKDVSELRAKYNGDFRRVNPHLIYSNFSNVSSKTFWTNSYGMRDDEIDLRQDTYRVLLLGGSEVGGEHGQNLKRNLDDYFEEKLSKLNIPGFNRVQVINSGTGGWSSIQHYIQSFTMG